MPLHKPDLNVSAGASSGPTTGLTFSNANGVSFGLNGSTLTASVATSYRASNDAVGLNTALTANGVAWTVNSSGISLNVPAFLTTADLSANSSKYVQNWKLTGNTIGTTSSAQGTDLWLAGGNGVTISGSSNTLSFSVATNYQSQGAYLTTAALSGDTTKYAGVGETVGTIAGTDLALTVNTDGVSIKYPKWITTAMVSDAGSNFVAASANFNGTNISGTIASNAISLSVAAPGGGANLTVQDSATTLQVTKLIFSNANNVSFGLSTAGSLATVTASVATNYAGVGETVGTTAGTDLVLTVNTDGVSIGYPKWITNINVSAGTTSNNLSALVFSNSNGVIFGLNGSTITAQKQAISFFEPSPIHAAGASSSTYGLNNSELDIQPFWLQQDLTLGQVNMVLSVSHMTTTVPNTMTFSNTGANSFRFQATFSYSNSYLVDLFLFSMGSGGSRSDLKTVGSTRNSMVTFNTHTYDFSISNGAGSTGSWSIRSSNSYIVSYPAVTGATATSVNAATTVTVYGTGYGSIGSSTSNSSSTTYNTTNTASGTLSGVYPLTANWLSLKLVQFNFATSLAAGDYWIGIQAFGSASSSSSSATSNVAAGRTFTSAIQGSKFVLTEKATVFGAGNTVLNASFGRLGSGTINTNALAPGLGSWSASYDPAVTQLNNAGQANGEIALSDIVPVPNSMTTWMQFASLRI